MPIFSPIDEGRIRHRLSEFGEVEFFDDFVRFLQLNDTFAIFSFSFERNIDSTASKLFFLKKFSLAHFQESNKQKYNLIKSSRIFILEKSTKNVQKIDEIP